VFIQIVCIAHSTWINFLLYFGVFFYANFMKRSSAKLCLQCVSSAKLCLQCVSSAKLCLYVIRLRETRPLKRGRCH